MYMSNKDASVTVYAVVATERQYSVCSVYIQ